MRLRELAGAYAKFCQLYRELQTYTDAELAELGLTRGDSLRIAFRAAVQNSQHAREHAFGFGSGQLRRA